MIKRGFVCGVFDLFHAGHVLMLQDCAKQCGHLTVALNKAEDIDVKINPDKNLPIYSIEERELILSSCRYVDEVVIYETEEELENQMKNGKYSIRFLGDDYKGKPITGGDIIPDVIFLDRSHGMSTSNYKRRIIANGL